VSTVPPFLNMVDFAHRLVGPKPLEYLSGVMNRASGRLIPTWNPYMPRVGAALCPPCLAAL
jgi:D-lactate dehydrogenase